MKGLKLSGSFLFGAGFAFAAALQPGPLQAFLLSKVTEKGVRSTLPAAFAPLISDAPIAILMLSILKAVPQKLTGILNAMGGLLLLYLAWSAFRQSRSVAIQERQAGDKRPVPHTLMQAVAVNVLNPNPYLGWSLILGPRVLSAWAGNRLESAALIAGFYGTMIAMLALTIVLFGSVRFLSPRGRRSLLMISAAMLAALGILQLAKI